MDEGRKRVALGIMAATLASLHCGRRTICLVGRRAARARIRLIAVLSEPSGSRERLIMLSQNRKMGWWLKAKIRRLREKEQPHSP
ncbi:MAG: hypothetical protein DMG84_22560 [Acidobacteria bacterium]|nr:MAG: hypothetical protein DMG85_21080 [Acidobacteriota bacterium]PYX12061.1 MAG: hypothetical protein DMG84_22560 [Acidobacteriota bacterium]